MAAVLLAAWASVRVLQVRQEAAIRNACMEARAKKDWPRVEALALQWEQQEPQNAAPRLMLAEAAQEQGRLEQVVEHLDRLPADDPRTLLGWLEQSGLLFGAVNRPFEGAEVCRRILRKQPSFAEAWQRLIFFYAITLQRVELAQSARAAIRADVATPETYVYLIGADWITLSNGYDVTSRWLKNDPENEILLAARAMHFVNSAGLQDQGFVEPGGATPSQDGSDANGTPYHEQVIARYFAQYPQNLELLAYYLDQATTAGDTERVAQLLAQSPAAAAEDNRFWRYKGWLHAARNQWSEAETAFREALSRNPYDWKTQHQLAAALRQLRRMDEAKTWTALGAEGKQLRKTILSLPDVNSASSEVLAQMASYASHCGDTEVAQRLEALAQRADPESLPTLNEAGNGL